MLRVQAIEKDQQLEREKERKTDLERHHSQKLNELNQFVTDYQNNLKDLE